MSLAEVRKAEREALMTTLADVGPDAPTLCAGWTVRDVASHLVVSERYFGLPMALGYPLRRVLPRRARQRAMSALQAIGARQIGVLGRREWTWTLGRLASGSPALYGLQSIAPIRLVEEWVHHEDIRRANGVQDRRNSPELSEALWAAGQMIAKLPEFAAERQGIEIRLPDGRSLRIGDSASVRVEGEPGELLLFLSGRTCDARVTVDGDEEAIKGLIERLSV